jgi:hypothetical protein
MDKKEWLRTNLYDYPVFLHGQERMAENKPVRLSRISAYGQGRMAENKPLRLSLISAWKRKNG